MKSKTRIHWSVQKQSTTTAPVSVNPLFVLVLAVAALAPGRLHAQSNGSAGDDEIELSGDLVLVGPGVISDSKSESGGTFTSDRKTIYYSITDRGFTRMTILFSHLVGHSWTVPEVASFSGVWSDGDPHLTPDGSRMFFVSNRPLAGEEFQLDLDIWYVDRRDDGSWSDPKPVSSEINGPGFETYPSPDADGSLYFSRQGKLFVSRLRDGAYREVEELPFAGSSPAISPDGRFLVFMRRNPDRATDTDLWLSYHENGTWTEPKRFAAPVNSPFGETAPRITADGRYLTFSSERLDYERIEWPRERQIDSYEEALSELEGTVQNGLRNMYIIDISTL